MTGAAPAADLLVALVALGIGYVVGSLPLVSPASRAAGPGWAFLALTADLAKGVIPVAIGTVTVSWPIGFVAGVGAVLGAARPPRRWRGHEDGRDAGPAGATFVGAAFALAPPAAAVAALIGALVFAAWRLVGRDARGAALAIGLAAYPLLFIAVTPDVARVAGLLGLYLVAALVVLAGRRR